jgi:prophage tail gpP-like protein
MTVRLFCDGQVHRTWMSARVTRGLKRACSDFVFETPGEYIPTILPFMPCVIKDDDDLVLTGYVDNISVRIDAKSTRTIITGRSKVMDLVDCMPEFTTNQFNGCTIDAIARSVCAAFGIGVVVGPGVNVGDPFPDATFERAEKGFAYIERLARQRGILLTDDEAGNLVLATVGAVRAPSPLVMGQGGNVFRANGALNGHQRYSKYTVHSQAGIAVTDTTVQNAVVATAYDPGVPRYRPWSGIAESASLADSAQLRVNWEAAHRLGEGIKATLSVPDWRAKGALWRCNQLVACDVPRLALNTDLLIGEFVFTDDGAEGRHADLTVQPPSAFVPDPTKRAKGKGTGGGGQWTGIINVTSGAPT